MAVKRHRTSRAALKPKTPESNKSVRFYDRVRYGRRPLSSLLLAAQFMWCLPGSVLLDTQAYARQCTTSRRQGEWPQQHGLNFG
jgi:hypothetical protein